MKELRATKVQATELTLEALRQPQTFKSVTLALEAMKFHHQMVPVRPSVSRQVR